MESGQVKRFFMKCWDLVSSVDTREISNFKNIVSDQETQE